MCVCVGGGGGERGGNNGLKSEGKAKYKSLYSVFIPVSSSQIHPLLTLLLMLLNDPLKPDGNSLAITVNKSLSRGLPVCHLSIITVLPLIQVHPVFKFLSRPMCQSLSLPPFRV